MGIEKLYTDKPAFGSGRHVANLHKYSEYEGFGQKKHPFQRRIEFNKKAPAPKKQALSIWNLAQLA